MDNSGILHGTEALVARVEVPKVWIVIGEFSWRKALTLHVKPMAILIELSVGLSRTRTRVWSTIDSWATPWLMRCAMSVVVELQTIWKHGYKFLWYKTTII